MYFTFPRFSVSLQSSNGTVIPFGPFLAGGGLAVLLIGTAEVTAWLGLQAI